jgi:dipeptidyl aminopeptidase/acylaminoacyl peptidase
MLNRWKGRLGLLLLVSPLAFAGGRGFDVRDLVALDRVSSPVLSSDGRHLVFAVREIDTATGKPRSSLWHRDLMSRDLRPPRRFTPEDVGGASPAIGPDGTVYFLSSKSGSSQIWSQRIGADAPVQVSDYPLDVGSFKVSPDGARLALGMAVYPDCQSLACSRSRLDAAASAKASGALHDRLFVRQWDSFVDGRLNQLFVAELSDGKASAEPTRLTGLAGHVPHKPFGGDADYAWSPDSRSLAASVRISDGREPWSTNFDIWLVDTDAETPPRNLTAGNPAWDADPVFSADGRTLYYKAMQRPGFEADRFAAMALDLGSGQVREIAPDFDRSLESLALSPDGKRLLAQALDTGRRVLFAIDIVSGATEPLVSGGNIGSFAAAGQVLAFTRDTLATPAQVFTVPLDGGAERRITDLNADRLKGVAFGDYQPFQFPGWNDEPVHGYVIKPWNYQEGGKYPVAFLIHGGPQGSFSDNFHYRWNAQTYAGAGFAVVMIDFHGSVGYGQAFTDSITGDWGGKPLEDLRKGLAAAGQQFPFLATDRACALGGSYGGYMVNWIAGNWPDGFRCLVNHAGLFDNRMMYYVTEELWFPEWEHGGPYFQNPDGHERHNPVHHVEKWQTPMLVIHGQKDYRVPVEQGLATFTALHRRGIESRLLYFPDENHWVLNADNSILWHDTVNQWLLRWTQP